MISRLRPHLVGFSIVLLAAAVAVATSLLFARSSDSASGGASSGDAPPGVEGFPSADPVEGFPSADPVADRSPLTPRACDPTGSGTQSSDGAGVPEPKVSARSATALHRNDAGGYEFFASPAWKLREQGPLSRLVGPDRDFVVSLGPGPAGGLPHAYSEFVELVGKTYGNVRFGKVDASCAAGDLSVWRHGDGTNAAAAPFEFLVVIIERSSGGTVGAFGAWNPKTPEVRPLVLEVMNSFQAIPGRA